MRRDLLKDQAYRNLKRRIIEGEIAPGSFLSERQLVEQMGMSKTPIRAALERLEQDGFVRTGPQQGVIVRQLSLQEIIDHYDIRIALETFTVGQLARQIMPQHREQVLEQLNTTLAQQQAQIGERNLSAYVRLDGDFHLMLCEMLGNQEIIRVMAHQRDKLHRVTAQILERDPYRMQISFEQHVSIVEAIAQGNGPLAAERIRQHLDSGKRFLINL